MKSHPNRSPATAENPDGGTSAPNPFFDRVVVISLARRPDRLTQFRHNLKEHGWCFKEPELFVAVDGNKVPTPIGFEQGGGAWGCLQSHRQILEQAITDDVKNLLVLEDDAFLKTGGIDQLLRFLEDVPSDWEQLGWDQLMLGGQEIGKSIDIKSGVVKCTNCQRTHAYAIRGQFMRDLYATWCSPSVRVHCDWVMGGVQATRNVYAPDPFIFGQEAGKSDISGNDNRRITWSTPSGNQPVVLLTAPKEVVRQLRHYGLHTGYDRCEVSDVDNGLVAIFEDTTDQTFRLKNWLRDIQWEVAADEGLIATVWHPDATLEQLKRCTNADIITVTADTVEEALVRLPELKLKDDYSKSHVVVLHSPKRVVQELRGLGWHGGNWRDHVTDQDNGLREIFANGADRVKQLSAWIDSVGKECEQIRNGVLTIWYPDATAELVSKATSRKVVEIAADTTEIALEKWRQQK